MPASYWSQIQRKPTATHSSSAGDYRSVIDDQAIEIQKLKEKLKQYKQDGPSLLRKDKLFEFKVHGLSMEGKRELEAMLRDFATALGGSSDTSSSWRWKASPEGTGLSSDLTADSCQQSSETIKARSSNKSPSYHSPQMSKLPESIHYKPLFAQQATTLDEQSTTSDSMSSPIPIGDSNMGDRQQDLSISKTFNRRKRRHNGTIIYYSDAPFYTDLSRDPRDKSPFPYEGPSSRNRHEPSTPLHQRLSLQSISGLSHKPLSDLVPELSSASRMDADDGNDDILELITASSKYSGGLNREFTGPRKHILVQDYPLEPCGLGGVWPDDHFVVRVVTQRSNQASQSLHPPPKRGEPSKTIEAIHHRLATMPTISPSPLAAVLRAASSVVGIEYLSQSIKRMAPVSLPPAVRFVTQFSSDLSGSDDNCDWEDEREYNLPRSRC